MNFWTFLNRNFSPIFFFFIMPFVILGIFAGPEIIKALREHPACVDSKQNGSTAPSSP